MRLLQLFENTPRRVILSFQNGKGQVFNESVSIGFRAINEDDDITYEYPESEGWIYLLCGTTTQWAIWKSIGGFKILN